MASHSQESAQDCKEVKEDHDIWKKKYIELRKKYWDLAASCNKAVSDDEEESGEPPNKKQKVNEEIVVDGFGKLPLELIDKIFAYLWPKEVLESMCVSKGWKDFIASRYLDEAMDKIVVKFDDEIIRGFGYEELNQIMSSARGYKHMEVAVVPGFAHLSKSPFTVYASSLVTLKINYWSDLNYKFEPVVFASLRKLVIEDEELISIFVFDENKFESFIKASSFPELTHLKMPALDMGEITPAEFLQKFPKLKVLILASDYSNGRCWNTLLEDFESSMDQPKLEAIYMKKFEEKFLLAFKDSLTDVYIDSLVDSDAAGCLLTKFSKLETLAVSDLNLEPYGYGLDMKSFARNENVETLIVEGDIDYEFLGNLPSLRTLVFYGYVYENLIDVLSTNKNFKKLICHMPSNMPEYVKKKHNKSFKADFEIQTKTSEWKGIEAEFYNTKFK